MPYLVVLTLGITAVLEYLKEYEVCLTVNRSCKYEGVSLFIILKDSKAIDLKRRTFKDGNLDLDNSSQ